VPIVNRFSSEPRSYQNLFRLLVTRNARKSGVTSHVIYEVENPGTTA
jgi:hypothetical protein